MVSAQSAFAAGYKADFAELQPVSSIVQADTLAEGLTASSLSIDWLKQPVFMVKIGSFEAKTHFSDILRRVTSHGEKFIVTMRGEPVAMLGPIETTEATPRSMSTLLEEIRDFRAKVATRGPVLQPGETWNDFAREGLE